jgi:DnaJ-class molecular chaperone
MEFLREIDGFLQLSQDAKNGGRRRWDTQRKDKLGGEAKTKARQRAKDAVAPPPVHWSYEYLGCSESDSDETIKRCYRQLAVRLHPDKHAARVKTPEDAEPHMRAFQKLQSAYAEVWKLRGKVAGKS